MINGFKIMRNNRLVIECDFTDFVKIEGSLLGINLPGRIEPELTDGNLIKLGYVKFSPKEVYDGDIKGTLEGWKLLESKGVNLQWAAYTMISYDILQAYVGPHFFPIIPLVVSLAEMACFMYDLIRFGVKDVETLIPKIKKKINGCIKPVKKFIEGRRREGLFLNKLMRDAHHEISSINAELRLLRQLRIAGKSIIVNPKVAGCDFYVQGKAIHRVEVARRMGKIDLEAYKEWEEFSEKNKEQSLIPIHPTGLIACLVMEIAERLEEELKQGEIVIFDVSTTFEGFTLLAIKALSKNPHILDLSREFDKCLNIVEKGEKAILFYAATGQDRAAIAIPAEQAKKYASLALRTNLLKIKRQSPFICMWLINKRLLEKSE